MAQGGKAPKAFIAIANAIAIGIGIASGIGIAIGIGIGIGIAIGMGIADTRPSMSIRLPLLGGGPGSSTSRQQPANPDASARGANRGTRIRGADPGRAWHRSLSLDPDPDSDTDTDTDTDHWIYALGSVYSRV
jgi:hypothetical protein